jgi:hypothetical protein
MSSRAVGGIQGPRGSGRWVGENCILFVWLHSQRAFHFASASIFTLCD